MKYTQVAADAFAKLQLNAGILLTDFDPTTGAFERDDIFAATSGGVTFTAKPEYKDFGEDIDNVPKNTMELKKQSSVEVKLSGTAKTIDSASAHRLIGACDADGIRLVPRRDLLLTDFQSIWYVGDYSDKNDDKDGGFVAIHVMNTLNTGGFSLKSTDEGKADMDFEFTGHYSMADVTKVPFEMYLRAGDDDYYVNPDEGGDDEGGDTPTPPTPTSDVTLASLSIGTLALEPAFDPAVTEYATTTTNATNSVTATATDEGAEVAIQVNGVELTTEFATWDEGDNTVVVTVTNGTDIGVYTVSVTKGE